KQANPSAPTRSAVPLSPSGRRGSAAAAAGAVKAAGRIGRRASDCGGCLDGAITRRSPSLAFKAVTVQRRGRGGAPGELVLGGADLSNDVGAARVVVERADRVGEFFGGGLVEGSTDLELVE